MYHPLKYARVEQERRFLLKTFPEDFNPDNPFLRIIDHYISGTRLRLRRMESPSGESLVFKLGQKYQASGQKAHQRTMTNIYLTEGEYQTLAVIGGSSIIKRRYPYRYAGDDYSLDVFEGKLGGLILMEIESLPDRDISSLLIPEFAVKEVTDDPFFTGGVLAELSGEGFQQWLASL
jgi:CYTH domain-containing protein